MISNYIAVLFVVQLFSILSSLQWDWSILGFLSLLHAIIALSRKHHSNLPTFANINREVRYITHFDLTVRRFIRAGGSSSSQLQVCLHDPWLASDVTVLEVLMTGKWARASDRCFGLRSVQILSYGIVEAIFSWYWQIDLRHARSDQPAGEVRLNWWAKYISTPTSIVL